MPTTPALDLLTAFADAMAVKDAGAVGALFTTNPILVGSEDVVLVGREELDAFIARYATGDTTYRWEWDRTEHRDLADTAVALAVGTEVSTRADGEQRHPYRMTVVAIRTRGDWRIAQLHGSTPLTS